MSTEATVQEAISRTEAVLQEEYEEMIKDIIKFMREVPMEIPNVYRFVFGENDSLYKIVRGLQKTVQAERESKPLNNE